MVILMKQSALPRCDRQLPVFGDAAPNYAAPDISIEPPFHRGHDTNRSGSSAIAEGDVSCRNMSV